MASNSPSRLGTTRRVAVSVSAPQEAELRSALREAGFTVDDAEHDLLKLSLERDYPLIVCEVREETEALAQRLLNEATSTALVFIGPTGSDTAGQRRNVRELSIDVSVTEVVRVCQELARGGSNDEQWVSPPVSQPSMPFNVLPRVSEAPPSKHSMQAPLLPSSVPPSSRPASARRHPTLPPALATGPFAEDHAASAKSEISLELSKLLSDAEARVSRGLAPRSNAPEAAANDVVVELSGEVLAALEDPIGDYDSIEAPPPSRPPERALRPSSVPPSSRGARFYEQPNSETAGELTGAMDASQSGVDSGGGTMNHSQPGIDSALPGTPSQPAASGSAPELPPPSFGPLSPHPPDVSRRPLQSGGPTRADDGPPISVDSSRYPSQPLAAPDSSSPSVITRATRASKTAPEAPTPHPPSRQTETISAIDPFATSPPAVGGGLSERFDSEPPARAADSERPASVPAPSEPERTTTPPPSRLSDERITVRPMRGVSPLPPAPAVPRGTWLDAAGVQQPSSEDRREAITSRPPSGARGEQTRPPKTRADETAKPPPVAPPPSEFPAEMSLKRGDAAGILASAIRTRLTGALVFEAEGTVRRIVLRDGDFVTAASGARTESLLAFLVQQGTLPAHVEAELGHKIPNLGRHAGAALVAAGHLPQDQLWPILRAHAEFVIGRVLLIEVGTAGFEHDVPARLRAEPAVFGGATGSEVFIEMLRRVLEPTEALRRLGGQQAELAPSSNFELIDECALTQSERALVDTLERVPLGEALVGAPSAEFPCVLYALTLLQVLRASTPAAGQARISKRSRDRLDDEALRQAVLTRRRLIDEGDYFAVLGVPRHATGYDIRRAFLELKRQFEPSVALTPQTLDLREDLELIMEVLAEAYEILSDQIRRDRYRRAIESVPA